MLPAQAVLRKTLTVMVNGKAAQKRGIYGIQRVDHARSRTHCWIVRIQRRRAVWRRSFADRVYGGKGKALVAARAFRNDVLSEQLPMTRAEYASIKRKNNRSGVPGVCRQVVIKIIGGKVTERPCWIARWTTSEGVTAQRKFSIFRYGEQGALDRAKEARSRGLAELEGLYVTAPGLRIWLQRHERAASKTRFVRNRNPVTA